MFRVWLLFKMLVLVQEDVLSRPMEVRIAREMLMDKGLYSSTIHKLANRLRHYGPSNRFARITENVAKLLLIVKGANT